MNSNTFDFERYPTLTESGRRILEFMREHPAAPFFRNQSGNRLSASEVNELREYEIDIRSSKIGWREHGFPDWRQDFVHRAFDSMPFYRKLGSPPIRFEDIPPVGRSDLAKDIADFVPDHIEVDRMINFRTTGTTGHPLLIASHPVVAGRYLAFHKRAMDRFGVQLTYGAGQVGVVLLGFQRTCFTYVSVTPSMEESGLAKINLHPDDWRHPEDREKYLDAMAPEVIAGDPISLSELTRIPLQHKPRVILSVSMMLLPGLRQRLEVQFNCPVLDIYSLNEVGPVAVFDPLVGGHVLLQPNLYVEILDDNGTPLPPGQRGEIVVTGGFNFCLPLVRYRTGDFASLTHHSEGPVLIGLSGRSPVRYRLANGDWINNIDVTHALKSLALPHFRLHQDNNGRVCLFLSPSGMAYAKEAIAQLKCLFQGETIELKELIVEDKAIQYTSDLIGASS